jgi:CRISPR-associated protein Cmr2
MTEVFWQAKIWGLLHDSPLKPLQRSKSGEGPWDALKVMVGWQRPSGDDWIKQADYIASASDRAAMGALKGNWSHVNYGDYGSGIQLSHLLSGKQELQGQDFSFQLPSDSVLHQWRSLSEKQEKDKISELVTETIPKNIRDSEDGQKVFWWLWRCLPEVLSRHPDLNDPRLFLIPAETRIPDCSIWSHNSIVSALAGSLMGYDGSCNSRPYVVTFTFTPVQEVVKASRKMQDFWAGSWILHYLSACICWAWAEEYGPDSVVYPSLYAQPLIDHWLLTKKCPEWQQEKLVNSPSTRQLLTAGFPNVLVIVLPENKVKSATDLARRLLTGESPETPSPWMDLAEQVKQEVFGNAPIAPSVWEEWLKAQWQIYWTALPLGDKGQDLTRPTVKEYATWQGQQNKFSSLLPEQIFTQAEGNFVKQKVDKIPRDTGVDKFLNVNVGSWWASIFEQTRNSLNAVKNARVWSLPTAFGSRSTISGIGAVVRMASENDWSSYEELQRFWKQSRGMFDGQEQLNATEVVKRGLRKVLPTLLELDEAELDAAYPDLTAGVAGYLKFHDCHNDDSHLNYFHQVCREIQLGIEEKVILTNPERWGIPWIDKNESLKPFHSRFLNARWLAEEIKTQQTEELRKQRDKEQDPAIVAQLDEQLLEIRTHYRDTIQPILQSRYSSGTPADWYVLACGDGDDMGGWLKGTKMQPYRQYVPSDFPKQSPPTEEETKALNNFLNQDKRMGPATHAALSRALLDFSNQLVPYLTEQRYAGRLIYSGGDDVLAYTNLWEWDNWLWDVRQCFKGTGDPEQERMQKGYANTANPNNYFKSEGDYWDWQGDKDTLTKRPLFTMGRNASISFGIVIAHHSVPLAIALENLWAAEKEAKEHEYQGSCRLKDRKTCYSKKDAVQVRVLYGNGNILKASSKFDVFDQWKALLNFKQTHSHIDFDPALFEQAAEIWRQHPVPFLENAPDPFAAIAHWTQAFCERRELFKGEEKEQAKQDFQPALANYLKAICLTTDEKDRDREIQNWLKLAAFVLRKRDIELLNQEN